MQAMIWQDAANALPTIVPGAVIVDEPACRNGRSEQIRLTPIAPPVRRNFRLTRRPVTAGSQVHK